MTLMLVVVIDVLLSYTADICVDYEVRIHDGVVLCDVVDVDAVCIACCVGVVIVCIDVVADDVDDITDGWIDVIYIE